MAETGATKRVFYNSVYIHGVDDKRRVQIPAKWRPTEPDAELMLILWQSVGKADACLLVLPPAISQVLVDKMTTMPFNDVKAEALRRLLGERSDTVPVDKGGRICLPEKMAAAAGIGKEVKEVVLNGMFDRFQIWNPERFEASKAAINALAPDAYQLI